MRTRSEAIAANIAARITRNTRKRFSTLYADAIQETENMATPTDNNLNNDAAPLRRTANGPVKLGSHLAADSGSYAVPSIVPVVVKQTDYKNLKTGEDFRGQAAQPDPLKGNDTPVRGQTNDQLEGVGG